MTRSRTKGNERTDSHERPFTVKQPQIGIIDIGSNTIRLCTYALPDRSEAAPVKTFTEKKSVGLSAYVRDGIMTERGIKAAAKAIANQMQHARLMGCQDIRLFATAALRNCRNSAEATHALAERVGARIDILSARQEAEFGFMGIQAELDATDGMAVDIGGGSTELTYVKDGNVVRCCSIPAGSLSLWNAHVAGIIPNADELAACTRAFLRALDESGFEIPRVPRLFGTGGTIRNAARVIAFRAEGTDAATFTAAQFDDLLSYTTEEPGSYARAILAVEPARIHSLTPGTAILRAVFERSGARSIAVSKSGVREGYLHNLLATRTA